MSQDELHQQRQAAEIAEMNRALERNEYDGMTLAELKRKPRVDNLWCERLRAAHPA